MSQSAHLPPELLHDPPGVRQRDEAAISRAVERMAGRFVAVGMPRMPARVFFAILVSPEGALTAAEIGEALSVSPAAVSKAVQYLTQVHLTHREYVPGSRRDRYRVGLDQWSELIAYRARWMEALAADAGELADMVGPDTAAGARLDEMRDFLSFTTAEANVIFERWKARRDPTRQQP